MFQKLFVKKILINCLEILFGSCIKNSCSMSLMVEIILAHKKISTSRNQNILSAVLTYWNNKNCRFFLHFTYIHVSFFLKRNIALLDLICLFACLFWDFSSHSRIFHSYMEKSPLSVKDWKFWPMFGTHGHWAVRVLKRATPTVTRESVYNGHLRGSVTFTSIAKKLAVELPLPVLTT